MTYEILRKAERTATNAERKMNERQSSKEVMEMNYKSKIAKLEQQISDLQDQVENERQRADEEHDKYMRLLEDTE